MRPPTRQRELVDQTADEHRKKIVVWVAETSEASSIKEPIHRKISWEETRFDEGNFAVFQWDFSANFNSFSVGFLAVSNGFSGLKRKKILGG